MLLYVTKYNFFFVPDPFKSNTSDAFNSNDPFASAFSNQTNVSLLKFVWYGKKK